MKTLCALGILAFAATGCGDGSSGADLGADLSATMGDMTVLGPPTCMKYCMTIQTNCTGAPGNAKPIPDGGVASGNGQYSALTNCLNECGMMTVGVSGEQANDTVGCRSYHAGAAAGNAVLHCPHAGSTGGGVCGTDRCVAFCKLATAICNPAHGYSDPQFTSLSDCMNQCGKPPFKFDPNQAELVVDGPTLNCAFYHLTEAYGDPNDVDAGTAKEHCSDFRVTNPDRGCQ